MTVKKLTALVLSISVIKIVLGASFSNVFVESETSPTRYYQYSVPSYPLASSQYSQVNTIPASVSAYVNPCVSPCVIPGQSLTAVSPSANVVTYNAPQATVPVVVEPNETTKGYQYSYAIYESNNDRKVGSELSDGSMIRGEYSLAQPDGYVREIQYVADNGNRFNTLAKNYLPNAVADYRNSFTDGGIENSNYDNSRKKVWDDFYIKKVKESDLEKEFRNSKVKTEKPNKQTEERLLQKSDQNLELKNNAVSSRDRSYSKNEEKHSKNLKVEFQQNCDGSEEKLKGKQKDCNESSEESKEEVKENYKKAKNESIGCQEKQKQKSRKESKEKTSETKSEDGFVESTFVNYKNIEAHELMTPKQEVLVPYYDFVRCVQAALKNSNGNSEAKTEASSPLRYIVMKTPC